MNHPDKFKTRYINRPLVNFFEVARSVGYHRIQWSEGEQDVTLLTLLECIFILSPANHRYCPLICFWLQAVSRSGKTELQSPEMKLRIKYG